MESCSFCSEMKDEDYFNFFFQDCKEEHFNRIIAKNDLFCLLPTLGCFIEGYTLLVTVNHFDSFSTIGIGNLKSLKSTLENLKKKYLQLYSGVSIFEHGCVDKLNKAGACYQHAHLHIVPLNIHIDNQLLPNLIRINSVEDLNNFKDTKESYLYLSVLNDDYVIVNPEISSQFMRKIVANQINKPDLWNWREFPFTDNIIKTKNHLITEIKEL